MTSAVPAAQFALIGGSGTNSIDFPEQLESPDVRVLETGLVFETPFGASPPFKLLELTAADGKRRALTCLMHGWRRGVKRGDASLQLFWVFHEAGVRKILADGGVGSFDVETEPRTVVLPTDYIDFTIRKDIYVRGDHLLIMRNPVCRSLHPTLLAATSSEFERVIGGGVYVCTEGPQFESAAEIRAFAHMGAQVVGQSMCPEVVLARDIGACYARLDIVVNYAEGIVEAWSHEELSSIFREESEKIGKALLRTAMEAPLGDEYCDCRELRKPTLLSET
ncbi:MAG: phosphorylase [Actinobacteria bacterium]|nr:MAG: phosphorylase [Actinomycetota bacterium]